jgi:hypothetical protein
MLVTGFWEDRWCVALGLSSALSQVTAFCSNNGDNYPAPLVPHDSANVVRYINMFFLTPHNSCSEITVSRRI